MASVNGLRKHTDGAITEQWNPCPVHHSETTDMTPKRWHFRSL